MTDPTGTPQPGAAQVDAPRLHKAWLVALLPAGFMIGVIGGFMQEHRLSVGTIAVPWASLLVLAALLVTIRSLSLNMGTRLAGSVFYLGWLIATALLAAPNPSGDVVFTADAGSFGYLLAGGVLGAAAAAWPLFLSAPGPAPQPEPSDA